ncbi:hypothetical protein EYF80_039244 [Liparis tanakae]|uniref:Ig-like domain-containing protein n=1 Tax=Liparis tanakae TaxID=230148 RepID=A0A4Z2GD11_9TELE|nr:hypothetical protein EYF80_039244 [Liparis tanakae]
MDPACHSYCCHLASLPLCSAESSEVRIKSSHSNPLEDTASPQQRPKTDRNKNCQQSDDWPPPRFDWSQHSSLTTGSCRQRQRRAERHDSCAQFMVSNQHAKEYTCSVQAWTASVATEQLPGLSVADRGGVLAPAQPGDTQPQRRLERHGSDWFDSPVDTIQPVQKDVPVT